MKYGYMDAHLARRATAGQTHDHRSAMLRMGRATAKRWSVARGLEWLGHPFRQILKDMASFAGRLAAELPCPTSCDVSAYRVQSIGTSISVGAWSVHLRHAGGGRCSDPRQRHRTLMEPLRTDPDR